MNAVADVVAGFALGVSICAAGFAFSTWQDRKRKGR